MFVCRLSFIVYWLLFIIFFYSLGRQKILSGLKTNSSCPERIIATFRLIMQMYEIFKGLANKIPKNHTF